MRYVIGVIMIMLIWGNTLIAQLHDEIPMKVLILTKEAIPLFIEACPDYEDEYDVRDILDSALMLKRLSKAEVNI